MLGPDQRTLFARPITHPDGSKHAGNGTPTRGSTTGPEVINRLKGSNTLGLPRLVDHQVAPPTRQMSRRAVGVFRPRRNRNGRRSVNRDGSELQALRTGEAAVPRSGARRFIRRSRAARVDGRFRDPQAESSHERRQLVERQTGCLRGRFVAPPLRLEQKPGIGGRIGDEDGMNGP